MSHINIFTTIFTDADVIKREEEAIKIDELNVAQIKELRDKVSFVYKKKNHIKSKNLTLLTRVCV